MRFPMRRAFLILVLASFTASVAVLLHTDLHECLEDRPPRHLARLCTVVPSTFVSSHSYFAISTRGGDLHLRTHASEAGIDRWNESREINRHSLHQLFHTSLQGSKRKKYCKPFRFLFFFSQISQSQPILEKSIKIRLCLIDVRIE